jgi:hypothetical protein
VPSPAEATPTATDSIELINPSHYESPIIVSDKTDADNLYHFTAWVSNIPASPDVVISIQGTNGSPTPSPTTINSSPCDPATRVGNTDTWGCKADISSYGDGTYTVTATLKSGTTVKATDSQQVTIRHSDEALEILDPTNGGGLGVYTPPTPMGAPPGFTMTVKYSAGTSSVKGFYSASVHGSEPAWRRCKTQQTVYYADHTARIGCTVDPNLTTPVSAVAAVPVFQPADLTFPACTPAITTPPSITCPQAPQDHSGDAHRVFAYDQSPGSVTVSPSSQTVFRNSDNSQCTLLTAQVLDQFFNPVWRANVDVHAQGPADTLQFGIIPNQTSPFKAPDSGTDPTNHAAPEPAYNCNTKANDGTQQEGRHSETGSDTKHIESTTGSDASGFFNFALHSPDAGTTNVQAWWDENDNDDFDGSDARGTATVDWSAATAATSTSAATTTATTTTASPTATATPTPTPTACPTTGSASPSGCIRPTPTPTPTPTACPTTGSASPSGCVRPTPTPTPTACPTTGSASPSGCVRPTPTASHSTTPTTPASSTSSSSTSGPPPPDREASAISISYDYNAHSPARGPRTSGRGAFKGRVSNAKAKCRTGRRVRLVRKHHGVVGHTKSSGRFGNWKIFFPNAQGRFYARVLRKTYFDASGQKIVCLPDRSPTLVVKQ